MSRQPRLDRRSVLRTTGGLAAGAYLGSLGAGSAAAHEHERGVRVDQVGYLPGEEKVAVVVTRYASGDTFSVVDQSSGETVYEGELSDPIDDDNSNREVRHADFSEVEAPGEYVVEVGGEASYAFEIGEDVYEEVLRQVGRLYTLKRASTEIDDPETGLQAGPGHTQDQNATVTAQDDPVYDYEEEIDVSGGWYDAGDYGKYTAPSAITVGAKLAAYERNPEAFQGLDYNFPPGVSEEDSQQMPDALAEIKWKLEWLEKVQRRDGGMWFIVAGSSWPGNATPPEGDNQERYVMGLSTAATAMACANFAQAARVYREIDGMGSFADRMLENARDAFGFLEDNPDLIYRVDPNQTSGNGPYHRGPTDAFEHPMAAEKQEYAFEDPLRFEEHPYADSDIDGFEMERFDRFWAAAELLKTTGEQQYQDHLEENLSDLFSQKPIDFDWYNGLAIGQIAYYTADAADEDRREEVGNAILEWADERLEHVQQDGFNNALTRRDYHWASAQKGATYGVLFMLANDVSPDPAYVEAALDQLHHVLGRTATGYTYMTGIGDYYPETPHDRLANSTGTLLPGQVVGGPNDGDMWPQEGYSSSDAPYDDPGVAHYYADDFNDYMVNEWAINYTAPVFWLLAEALTVDFDGGSSACEDASTMEVEGQTVCDLNDDGAYRDVNGDGDVGQDDVVDFFDVQHRSAWKQDAFDFSGNGEVNQFDVVDLFDYTLT